MVVNICKIVSRECILLYFLREKNLITYLHTNHKYYVKVCNVVVLPEIKKKRNIVICGFILKVLCIFALFPDFENYLPTYQPIREMGKMEKCHLKKE